LEGEAGFCIIQHQYFLRLGGLLSNSEFQVRKKIIHEGIYKWCVEPKGIYCSYSSYRNLIYTYRSLSKGAGGEA
jgi:hypothetical protein